MAALSATVRTDAHTPPGRSRFWPLARPALLVGLGAVLLTCTEGTGPNGANIQLLIEGPATVRVSEAVQLTARVPQVSDLGPGRITWRASDTSLVALDTVGSSTSVQGRRLGLVTITATLSAPDLAASLSQTHQLTVEPGPPVQLLLSIQPSPTAQAGKAIPQQPAVQVTDVGGNAVAQAGVQVTAELTGGAGTLAAGTATTGANGVATFSGLTIVGQVGSYTLRFTAAGLTATATNPIQLTPGDPTQLVLTTPPAATARAGAPFTVQPVVQLRDLAANDVGLAGIVVRASATTTGAAVTGVDTSITNASGAAGFTDLGVSGPIGAHLLAFSSPGLSGASSTPIAVAAGDAAALAFRTQPSTTAAGSTIAPAVEVVVQDVAGNLVASATPTVTVAFDVNPGGGTLAGTLAAPAVAGVATFGNLSIGLAGTGYALAATAPSLTRAVSGTFDVLPGSANRLALTSQPVTAQSGVPLAVQPIVQLQDALGNAVSLANVPIAAALGSGAGALTGTVVVNTTAGGTATFTDLVITGPPGSLTLAFSTPGIVGVTSNSIALTFGPAAQLAFSIQPSSVVAGVAIGPPIQVSVRDASGNLVMTATNPIDMGLSTNPGGGALSGTTRVAAANGTAVFTDLSIDKVGIGYALAASASGLTGDTSIAFDVAAGAADTVVASSPTSQTDTVGSTVNVRPSVRVTDSYGNGVPNVSVTFAVTAGGGTVSGAAPVTDASGAASVGSWILGTQTGGNEMTASVGTLRGSPVLFSVAAEAGPPSPATSLLTTTAGTVEAGLSVTAVLRTRDQYGNTITRGGATVVFSRSGGTSTGSFGTTVDSSNGVYSATFTGNTTGTPTTIHASIGSSPVTTLLPTVLVTPGPLAGLVVHSGNGQSATPATGVELPPTVRARDSFGNSLAGIPVTFRAGLGAGFAAPVTPVATDSTGLAAADSWILGPSQGPNTLIAETGALSATFSATGVVPSILSTFRIGNDNLAPDAHDIAVNNATGRVYVVSPATSELSVIDANVDTAIARIAAGSSPTTVAVNERTNRVYVGDANGVIVIDGANNSIIATVPIAGGAHRIAINPRTNTIYAKSFSRIHRIDGTSNTVLNSGTPPSSTVGDIAVDSVSGYVYFTDPDIFGYDDGVGAAAPDLSQFYIGGGSAIFPAVIRLAVDPARQRLYALTPSALYRIDMLSWQVTPINFVGTGNFLCTFGVNASSGFAHVADCVTSSLFVVDASSNVVASIAMGTPPRGVAHDASADKVYVATGAAGTVTVVSASSHAVVATVFRAGAAGSLAVNTSTGRLFVTHPAGGTVSMVDGLTHSLIGIPTFIGGQPTGVAVNPVTNRVYVANAANGRLYMLDGADGSIRGSVAVGSFPMWVAVNPKTNRIYVMNSGDETITLVDGTTNTALTTAFVGRHGTGGMVVDTATGRVWIADDFRFNQDGVLALDGSTLATLGGSNACGGAFARGIAVNPRNGSIYYARWDPLTFAHSLDAIDATDLSCRPSGPTIFQAYAVAFNPRTNVAFVADATGIRVVSGAANIQVHTLSAPVFTNRSITPELTGMVANPTMNRIYFVNANQDVTVIQN